MLWYKDKKPWIQSEVFEFVAVALACVLLVIAIHIPAETDKVDTKCVPQNQIQHSPSQRNLTQKSSQ